MRVAVGKSAGTSAGIGRGEGEGRAVREAGW